MGVHHRSRHLGDPHRAARLDSSAATEAARAGGRVSGVSRVFRALPGGSCAAASVRAEAVLDETVAEHGMEPDFTYVFPEALGAHRFRAVARQDGEYRMWQVNVLTRRAKLAFTEETEADHPDVRAVRRTERGRTLEWFFKAPVWKRVPGEPAVEVHDLRFRSTVLGDRLPFVFRLRCLRVLEDEPHA